MYKFVFTGYTCTKLIGRCHAVTCSVFLAVPDPCMIGLCDKNADCMTQGAMNSVFTCTCREPFTDGDGFNCSSAYYTHDSLAMALHRL